MSKKTEEKTTPGWSAPPPTAATTALQGMVDQGADFSTPIRNAYARAKQENDRSYRNPLGAFTTADVRDKSQRSQNASFNQNMGIDLANAAQQNAQNKFGNQATVAGLTSPQMYTANRTTTTRDPWGTAIGIGGLATQIGLGAVTGGSSTAATGAAGGAGGGSPKI